MSANSSLLPREVVAMVQHIELNKAGWWDKAVQRLVLAAIWLENGPPDVIAIQKSLNSTFKLSLSTAKLTTILEALQSSQLLIILPQKTYRIPQEKRAAFEREIAESEQAENEAEKSFRELILKLDEGLDSQTVWADFENKFLGPLIKQVGANAYRLVVGEKMTADKALVDDFLKPFPKDLHNKLRELVADFLDPKKPEVCGHISRMLHARFCVEASGLSESVLQKLNVSVGKQVQFYIFIDTNFLFSILELHENPSNIAAQELLELFARLNGNPRIKLFITPDTIEEAKASISFTKELLKDLPSGGNFTNAALRGGFSGMATRFFVERNKRSGNLSASDWLDPYLNDFLTISRSKGVELFNEKLDNYSNRQDVIDDINEILKHQEGLPENKRKTYAKVKHDMVLWHFVDDKRAAYVESPIDATYWILTVDFRFISFDDHKKRNSQPKVPLCIHPTSLIQLLQFWVPRTKEFEEAMLGSLRLPFLFQDFDIEGEKISLKIMKDLGRFDGSEGFTQETIANVMLNEGLRARIKTETQKESEIELVRDALVEEMKQRSEAVAAKAQALEREVQVRDSRLTSLAEEKRVAEEQIVHAKKEKEEADEAARMVLANQGGELEEMKRRLQAIEQAENFRAEGEEIQKNKKIKK